MPCAKEEHSDSQKAGHVCLQRHRTSLLKCCEPIPKLGVSTNKCSNSMLYDEKKIMKEFIFSG
ncbi:unnamed protein product [Gulo gulo]|uniref:Uncharacterized protein n=1 Tax=Gulo gulo TaxID=48420 RepID=A0A9X9Q2C9_GULGU|nr:unnamed protein product [Gulo gulo]